MASESPLSDSGAPTINPTNAIPAGSDGTASLPTMGDGAAFSGNLAAQTDDLVKNGGGEDAATIPVEDDYQSNGLANMNKGGAGISGGELASKEKVGTGAGGGADQLELGNMTDQGAQSQATAAANEVPPDGGYGWVNVFASFAVQAFTLGLQTSFGPFQRYYVANQTFGSTSNVQIAFISSICTAVTFLFGPLCGQLCEKFGYRQVAGCGAVLIMLGMELSSLATAVWHLYLSYGVLTGLGAAASYIPAVGIVPQWFRNRLGLAIGISVAGGGIGGLILNPLSQALLDQLGYPWTYRILGFISGGVALLGAMFLRTFGTPKPRKGGLRNLVDFSNFKDFTFTRLYIMAICSGMGYFVPYAFTVPFATSIGVPASTGSGMAAVTNAFGAIGRIGVGLISDRVGSMNCWAVAFLLGALSILVIWTNAYTPGVLWFFAVVWGAASGAYVSLYGVNTAKIWGGQGQAALLGMLYTALIPGALVGPVIAGAILDSTATTNPDGTLSYHYLGLQLYAGFCVLAAASIVCWIRLEFGAKKGGKGVWDGIWMII